LAHPATDVDVDDFFASRSGVCVYIPLRGRTVRVQFASPTAGGVVAGGSEDADDEALAIARAALQRYQDKLAPLFDKVARKMT
jgi:hypothetical protein